MSKKLFWVALMALLLTVVGMPSWANPQLPTSENPAKGNWTKMHPTSFAPTVESALEQCERTAKLDSNDRLTPEMCQVLEQKLKAKTCQSVSVADGVVFDHMNGRVSGRSQVTHHVKKLLGRNDPALLCDLGDEVYAYWFVGDTGRSCNNVGFVYVAKPIVQPIAVAGACGSNATSFAPEVTTWPQGESFCQSGDLSPSVIAFPATPGSTSSWQCPGKNGGAPASCIASRQTSPPEKVCEWVTERYIVPQSGQNIYVPGLSVAVCNGQVAIPATFVSIPGDVMTIIRQTEVCK